MPEPETPEAESAGEVLYRFERRHRPHLWSEWRLVDDAFRAEYEIAAAQLVAVVQAVSPPIPRIEIIDR